MTRYNRHIILSEIGQKGQNKLLQSKVLIVGAGGLGCPILQYLAAAGVGTLGIIDFDVVDQSNLQRQILFGMSSLGKNKALAAKERLLDLNPTISIHSYPEKLTIKNAESYFKKYDIIVDSTDNFETRYLINDAALITNKPVVFGAIYKFEGQVSVFNYKNGPSYRCLFPTPPEKESVPNCSEIGVLGVLPGIIGTLQANEVLKMILGIGTIRSGELLYYNSLNNQTSFLKVSRKEDQIKKVLQKGIVLEKTEDNTCSVAIQEKSFSERCKNSNTLLVDVREYDEEPKLTSVLHLQIPLSELENRISELNINQEILFFCQSGMRSKKAVEMAQNHQIKNSFRCKENILELIEISKKQI